MTIPRSANRGVHTANFRVLRLANYPAVLVECGFSEQSVSRVAKRVIRNTAKRWADRIAEAIVEQRYGPGIYRASRSTPPNRRAKVVQVSRLLL